MAQSGVYRPTGVGMKKDLGSRTYNLTASLASSGIVTVPGMMAGQIIAGGNPIDAAKYQFLILAAIAALTLLADSLIMVMAYRKCFTADDQYNPITG